MVEDSQVATNGNLETGDTTNWTNGGWRHLRYRLLTLRILFIACCLIVMEMQLHM